MRKQIIAKLRGCSGETIGETLVALLIAALALMMMAGAIQSSYNAVERGRDALDKYYAASELLANPSGGLTDDNDVVSNGVVTIGDKECVVTYYVNKKIGSTPVIAYH